MSTEKKLQRRALDRRFKGLRKLLSLERPRQGWIRTIREALGMTTTQLAKRMGVTQPRIVYIEKNESNLKLSTLESVAKALNCRLVYALIPDESLVNTVYNKTKEKAITILKDVNANMALEDQHTNPKEFLDVCIQEIVNDKPSCIWNDNHNE